MDEILLKINKTLKEKEDLMQEAKILEEKAKILRDKASHNNIKEETKYIQDSLIKEYNNLLIWQNIWRKITKLYDIYDDSITIPILEDDYKSKIYDGKSIEDIEQELENITKNIISLRDILENICKYIGHNYEFIGTEKKLNFDYLEVSFDDLDLYCCTNCGKYIFKDEPKRGKQIASNLLDRVTILKQAQSIKVYNRKFHIVDIMDENIKR